MSDRNIPDVESVVRPPRRALRYELIDTSDAPIGRGGQAVVYEGAIADGKPPERIALKEPPHSGTLTGETIDQFLHEARRWATVDSRERNKHRWADSEHIVGVVDTGEELPWIAIEYMDGGSLEETLDANDDGLPLDQALWIGECLCQGLAVAHAYGIVHLDLKPANVLFRETAEGTWDLPKIGDWGLSRVLSEQTGTMDGLSVTYAAPEQFESDEYGDPDTLTDVYQAGAVVYALLTGEPPYTGSQTSVMHDVVYGDPPTPPSEYRDDVSDALDTVVSTALETEKRDRYDSIQSFKRALHAVRTDGRLPAIVADQIDQPRDSVDTTREPRSEESQTEESEEPDTRDDGDDQGEYGEAEYLLGVLVTLSDEGDRSVASGELVDHVDYSRGTLLENLDELKDDGLAEYTSDVGSGYKPTNYGVQRAPTVEVEGSNQSSGTTSRDEEATRSGRDRSEVVSEDRVADTISDLARQDETPVSSEKLSTRLGASRGAVLDALDTLKDDGRVEYRSGANSGYVPSGATRSRSSTSARSRRATVEYLNYETVVDRGWDPQSEAAFDRAENSDLSDEDYGTLEVGEDEYILEAAEDQGLDWPYSCRAGACTNCASILVEGEVDMDNQQILSDEELEDENVFLSCIATRESDTIKMVYNAKRMDRLQNRVI